MNRLRRLLRAYLYLRYWYHRTTHTGSFGKESAKFLKDHPPADGNPLKQALFRHYVRQFHESSCSVASVAMAVNAILDTQKSLRESVTQFRLLDTVQTGNWKKRMSPGGDNGKRGLPLPLLGKVVKSSLRVHGVRGASVETVQAVSGGNQALPIRQTLFERLNRFEIQGDCLLIAHFDQGAYVRGMNIPHISPVGGFDPTTGMVTVLDVDATIEGPYAVGFERFYKGLASDYHHIFRLYGYRSGGYVFVQF